jgi:ATP-dependent DNA helicase DinG
VLKFRQGIGRLIRSRTDTGIVTILDSRVTNKFYGARFMYALPATAPREFL